MKKLILSTAFAMSVLAVSAQTGGGINTKNEINKSNRDYLSMVSTDNDIRQLSEQMRLNEGQYIRLRDLTRAKNEQIREVSNMYANDAAVRQQKLQALNQEFERQLAQTVSQAQFTAYLETQGRTPANGTNNPMQATGNGGQTLEGAATGTSLNGGAANTNDGNNVNIGNDRKMKANKAKKESRRNKMKMENKQNEPINQ